MSPRPNLPCGHAIFCDDVRTEISAKEIIVGAYNGDMVIVGEFPTRVLQLNVLMRLFDDPATFPKKVVFRVTKTSPSGVTDVLSFAELDVNELPAEMLAPDATGSDHKFVMVGVAARMENLEFTEPCRLRAIASVGGQEIWLGALGVNAIPAGQLPTG